MGENAKIIAVSIQKGGTGKSLCSLNLAYALSKAGKTCVLIDDDGQGTSSLLSNVDINEDFDGLHTLIQDYVDYVQNGRPFTKEDVAKCIVKPTYEVAVRQGKKYVTEKREFGYYLIPTNINLANYDIILNQLEINNINIGAQVLKKVIEKVVEFFPELYGVSKDEPIYCIIDVLPGLNMLAYSAIFAAKDGIIMPITVNKSSITGGENLLNCVTEIQHICWDNYHIKHNGILGVVKNQFRPRLKVVQELDSNLYNYFGPAHIFESTIPNKTNVDTAHARGRMFAEFDKDASVVFDNLAKEVVAQIEKRSNETEPVFIEKFGKDYFEDIDEK